MPCLPSTAKDTETTLNELKFFRLLLKHDAYFVVLCPGTNAQVGQIQKKTPFLDYPFISTDGGAVELVRILKVHLSDAEFMPAMLQVTPHNLAVKSVYIGRGPGQYFHQYLLKRLTEARCQQEISGVNCLRDANDITNQLKRKSIKCQQGKMASSWINLTRPITAQHSSITSTKRPLNSDGDEAITMSNHATAECNQSTSRLYDLPPEILETILDCLSSDIPSLVKVSGTSRKFYVAVCNVLISSIRHQIAFLKPGLPQQNGQVVWETSVADESLDRWSDKLEGVPYHELFRRVSDTEDLLAQIVKWTRHWSPRSNLNSIKFQTNK
ncbi:hypothetical protein [Parasitella parasitica]|uniref:F-box domain-containing protein n=1 Tax=Parasitella parasitica TaxID=35722 RepID=A0A0B7MS23_9FUNG|nr:hypothetical protein [Parasitella parasitica]